jgi:hypothetical protein
MEELACRAVAEAERGRRRWVNLLRVSWDEGPNKDSLLALTHAHASDLRECLEFAFTRPSLRAAAMEIVADDPLWVPQVLDMVLRGHSGNVGVPMEDATRYLIKQGYSVAALIRALLENRGFNWAMSLSLEFAPSYLKTVLKQRLRSQYWHDRLEASAILIASGSAWGREELLRRLEECESHNESIEVRSALGRSGDAEAIAAIEQWEATHPKKKPPRGGSGRAAYRKQGGCRADLEKVVQKFGNRLAEIGHLLDGDCEGQIEMSGEDDAATRKIAIVG